MAVLTAVCLINQTPSRILYGLAPFQLLRLDTVLFPLVPRVFGCTCFVQDRSPTRTKLDNKSLKCIFLGYSTLSKGYRCYDSLSRRFYHSMDVTFCKAMPFFGSNPMFQDSASCAPPPAVSPSARLVPIIDSFAPSSSSVSAPASPPPLQTYSRCPRAPPPPASSSSSGQGTPSTTPSPAPSRYPTREHRPPNRFGWFSSTNHLIS
ncbi:unnamed protein product [Camellia sinensis]